MKKKAKILCIDDEEGIRFLLEEIFSDKFEVHLAEGVNSGKKIIDETKLDLIISDIKMPDGSGIEILHYAKEHDRSIPVILISAHGEKENAINAVKGKAFDYFEKPFEEVFLIDSVERGIAFRNKEIENVQLLDELKIFQDLLNHSSDAIFVISPQTRMIFYHNQKASELFLDEKKGSLEVIEDLDSTMIKQFENIMLNQFKNWSDFLIDIKVKKELIIEGNLRNNRDHVTPLELSISYETINNDEFIIVISRDISLRKKKEQELLKAKAEIQQLAKFPLENPSPVLRVNRDGKILILNDASKNMLIKLGHNNFDEIPHSWFKEIDRIFNNRESVEFEITINNSTYLLQCPYYPSQTYTNVYGIDISELKQKEYEIIQAKKMADMASSTKSEFLANMSHEIRTPLNAIVGFSQILVNKGKKSDIPEDIIRHIATIQDAGVLLSELVNSVLDLSKIEAGKYPVIKEEFNLKVFIQSLYHILLNKAQEKDINFNYDLDPNLPNIIYTDRTKLNQILMNILSNAIKFTPPGKNITFSILQSDHALSIKIKDEGIGIPEDKIDKIFDSFEQVDASRTKQYGGTGLGLAICKKLVSLLEGTINVESVEQKGTTFTLNIPFTAITHAVQKNDEIDINNISFCDDNKILVVEDNPMNQEMIQVFFDDIGLKISIASDGKTGVQLAKELQPDIIFMDMHMPGMDGIETTQKLKESDDVKDIPVIALSAEAFIDQQERAKKVGISHYLTKPIKFDQVYPLLIKYLKYENKKGNAA